MNGFFRRRRPLLAHGSTARAGVLVAAVLASLTLISLGVLPAATVAPILPWQPALVLAAAVCFAALIASRSVGATLSAVPADLRPIPAGPGAAMKAEWDSTCELARCALMTFDQQLRTTGADVADGNDPDYDRQRQADAVCALLAQVAALHAHVDHGLIAPGMQAAAPIAHLSDLLGPADAISWHVSDDGSRAYGTLLAVHALLDTQRLGAPQDWSFARGMPHGWSPSTPRP